MSTFAVLNSNKVINIIVADTVEIANAVSNAECVEYTEQNPAQIGWVYDPLSNTFAPEVIVEVVTNDTI
jgi:hypothetical protein